MSQILEGIVTSVAGHKTARVKVRTARLNKFYNRIEKSDKNYAVHDPECKCVLGDKVRIESCRPMSRTKRFKLAEVLARGRNFDKSLV
jgi:small subunit ribosomal protein S17